MTTVTPRRLTHWSRIALVACCALTRLVSAHAAEEIVIGRTVSLSGPVAIYGQAKRDGADLVVQEVNTAGGIRGQKIRVVTLDDAYDPERAIANVRRLDSADKVVALMNVLGVPVVSGVLPVVEQLKLPTVGLSSGSPVLRESYRRYVFPVRASYREEAGYLLSLLKTLGMSRVLLIEQQDAFGRAVADGFREAAAAQQVQISATVMAPRDAPVSPELLTSIQLVQPQAILLALHAVPASAFIKHYRSNGGGAALYAMSPTDATQVAKLTGSLGRGIGFSQVVPLPDGGSRQIVREYLEAAKAAGQAPSFYGLEGFIEARIVVQALRKAGTVSREALVDALEREGRLGLGGFDVEYGRTAAHKGSSFVELVIIGGDGRLFK